VERFITGATYQAAGIKEPVYSVTEEKTNSKELSYFDFVVAGILGMALMNSSIIGIAVGMNKYKEDKILKRITTAPIKNWWFIAGEVLSRLVMNMIQISVILFVSHFFFEGHIYGNILNVYILALMGAILFQLIGFVIAGLVKTTQAAEGAATAITMPMMFLGGVFFPIDTLPKWLYSFVQYLPIAPFLRMMRGVVLEGNSLFYNSSNLMLVVIWIIICLGLATWKFRLNEE
jgi:ABC-2 type transport system permease protein